MSAHHSHQVVIDTKPRTKDVRDTLEIVWWNDINARRDAMSWSGQEIVVALQCSGAVSFGQCENTPSQSDLLSPLVATRGVGLLSVAQWTSDFELRDRTANGWPLRLGQLLHLSIHCITLLVHTWFRSWKGHRGKGLSLLEHPCVCG